MYHALRHFTDVVVCVFVIVFYSSAVRQPCSYFVARPRVDTSLAYSRETYYLFKVISSIPSSQFIFKIDLASASSTPISLS